MSFGSGAGGTHVRIVHVWEEPGWSKAGERAARLVIERRNRTVHGGSGG